jgi:hypothetical protein
MRRRRSRQEVPRPRTVQFSLSEEEFAEVSEAASITIPRHLVSGERSWVREAYGPGCRAADAGAGLVRGRSDAGRAIDRLAGQSLAVYMASGHTHIVACVNDDGVIRKEQPSQWPSIRRGRALSAAKALGSR